MMQKKICIINSSLDGGGAERYGAILSFMLENLGYSVFNVITKNQIGYKYTGDLYNLELECYPNYSTINKFKKLQYYFKKNAFDFIIDNRTRNSFIKEFILYNFVFKAKKIIPVVHNYNLNRYLPKHRFLAHIVYRKVYVFITVSKAIKKQMEQKYKFKNIITLYNSVDMKVIESKINEVDVEFKNYILYFGRIDEKAKNLTLLLNSYAKSKLKEKDIKLLIMGRGDDLPYLQNLVKNLNLQKSVKFIGYQSNPFSIVKNALFTVLSSRYEGFPMSIIESLAIGTPVISVDCESGPNEIIKNKVNGLLVKNNDCKALANALNKIVDDEVLYKTCKSNAKSSVAHLDVNEIKKHWKNLIDNV